MQTEDIDVLIVGSGPSGVSTALHLMQQAPAWAQRMVVVDRAVHPRDKLCGGGITHLGYNVLARLGIRFEPLHVKARRMHLVYLDRRCSLYGNPVFRIVRRNEFDHWLVRTAEARGVHIRQGEAVRQVTPKNEYVEVITTRTIFQAKVIVGADGSNSLVRRALNSDNASQVARLLEVLTPETPRTPEFLQGVAVFDFTPLAEGVQGYYWDFPCYLNGQPYMNRGVFDSRTWPQRTNVNLKLILREALAQRGQALDLYELKGHPIRCWNRHNVFAQPRVLLVGDAAGVDPLMGEGISFALGYGEPAAAAIVEAFECQDFSFSTYPKRLRTHVLFAQLEMRAHLARLLYRFKPTPLAHLIWPLIQGWTRLSVWNNPEFVADEPVAATPHVG
jgi:flavin-dependent dehydrogenase